MEPPVTLLKKKSTKLYLFLKAKSQAKDYHYEIHLGGLSDTSKTFDYLYSHLSLEIVFPAL